MAKIPQFFYSKILHQKYHWVEPKFCQNQQFDGHYIYCTQMKNGISLATILNLIVPKYFFEVIYYQYTENFTHDFSVCALDLLLHWQWKIVDVFYRSESLLFGNWKKGRSYNFEELRGTQDIADFYDLLNSPPSKTPKTVML